MCDLIHKIQRKWMKSRLQPIRVYCMHHVCAMFDAESMNDCDWMQIDDFKSKIITMRQNGVKFISLTDAYHKISDDKFRIHRYAVITFDDGYASLKEILPWLNQQQIPVTLFLNPAYFDGKHYRHRSSEKYLLEEEIQQLHKLYPLLTIGSHGWEHKDATKLNAEEFEKSITKSVEYLRSLPNYIPYYAFTYGHYTIRYVNTIKEHDLIPILVSGGGNYTKVEYIDRELL